MKTGRRTFYIMLQLFGALIWGLGFAFQSIGMENTGPFTFNSVRFMLATVVVFFFSVFTDLGRKRALKKSGEAPDAESLKEHSWKNAGLWKTGIVIGILLSLAGNLQQVGILYTDSVGKAGFIANGKALGLAENEGWVKLLCDAGTKAVIGAVLVGPEVSELLPELSLAAAHGLTSEDIALNVHAHPTLSEVLMEAAEQI